MSPRDTPEKIDLPLHIAIIGGGLGGLGAAISLQRAGRVLVNCHWPMMGKRALLASLQLCSPCVALELMQHPILTLWPCMTARLHGVQGFKCMILITSVWCK